MATFTISTPLSRALERDANDLREMRAKRARRATLAIRAARACGIGAFSHAEHVAEETFLKAFALDATSVETRDKLAELDALTVRLTAERAQRAYDAANMARA